MCLGVFFMLLIVSFYVLMLLVVWLFLVMLDARDGVVIIWLSASVVYVSCYVAMSVMVWL